MRIDRAASPTRLCVMRIPRGLLLAGSAVGLAGLLMFHRFVPTVVGSLLQTFLVWLILAVPVLVELALLRRSALALAAALLPVIAWCATFGGLFLPASDDRFDLTVVQHNVSDTNPDPAGTARTLAAARPSLIGLVEVTHPAYAVELRDWNHTAHGTVGLWSSFPIVESRHLDIKPSGLTADWNRGLRAVVRTPHGDLAVYVVHLPSVRLDTARRDDSARKLAAFLKAEPLRQVILIGDLNATVDDRGVRPVTSQLSWARRGVALSFPAMCPVARIDQIMARNAVVTSVQTLPRTASNHLPVVARVRL